MIANMFVITTLKDDYMLDLCICRLVMMVFCSLVIDAA